MKETVKPSLEDFKYIGTYEMVLVRNYYYRNIYHKLMIICLGLLAITAVLAVFLHKEIKNIEPPKYFATTNDGVPLALIDLSLPNLQPNNLLTWASEATIAAYSINFVNYRTAVQNARSYFTRKGYLNYLNAVKDSNNLEAVKRKKMVVYARINGTPVILKDSNSDPNLRVNGAFTWQVQIPVVITFENSVPDDKIVQNNIVTMLVTRMSVLESPIGVGIDSFIIREVLQ